MKKIIGENPPAPKNRPTPPPAPPRSKHVGTHEAPGEFDNFNKALAKIGFKAVPFDRFKLFSDEELKLIKVHSPGPGGNAGLRPIDEVYSRLRAEWRFELVKRGLAKKF